MIRAEFSTVYIVQCGVQCAVYSVASDMKFVTNITRTRILRERKKLHKKRVIYDQLNFATKA